MEVEAKLSVDEADVAALEERVREAGGEATPTQVQDDLFWAHPCRDLVASDEAFRLRREGEQLTLTYKGPRVEGDLKVRPEQNVEVLGDPRDMLVSLGFRPAARLLKRRKLWHLPDVEVCIDRIDGVGAFVEIEAAAGIEDPARVVEGWVERLALSDQPHVMESYLELALNAGARSAQRFE